MGGNYSVDVGEAYSVALIAFVWNSNDNLIFTTSHQKIDQHFCATKKSFQYRKEGTDEEIMIANNCVHGDIQSLLNYRSRYEIGRV